MKSKNQLVYEKLEEYVSNKDLKKVDVVMGEYKGNRMCQHNARQALEEGRASHIVSTLCFIPNSGVRVHFMPVVDGKITDNTNGYLSKNNTYFLLKEYYPSDLEGVGMSKLLVQTQESTLKEAFSDYEDYGVTLENI